MKRLGRHGCKRADGDSAGSRQCRWIHTKSNETLKVDDGLGGISDGGSRSATCTNMDNLHVHTYIHLDTR